MYNNLELIDIEDIIHTEECVDMIDISVEDDESFQLSNGILSHNSAISAFRKYRDTQTMGGFSLRGKIVNVSDMSNYKLSENREIINLMAAIGLKLGQPVDLKSLRYGRILFYVDADHDGNSIAGLLLNFFYKYWPDMFDRRMICRVETPIIIAEPKRKSGKKIPFYSQGDFEKWASSDNLKKYNIKYKKGLAALVGEEYDEIINNPRLVLINSDDLSGDSLEVWFGKDPKLRKEELLKINRINKLL